MGNILSISCSLDDLIRRCCDWIFGRSNYLFEFQEHLEALKSDWERLMESRKDVKRQVDMAEREQMQQLYEVQGWLTRVQVLESQLDQLVAEGSKELEQTCLGGCCPTNCCTRYKLGNRMAKMRKDVGDLIKEKPKRVVDDSLPPTSISERPSEATVGMDSKLYHALSSLHQQEVGILGLYGLGVSSSVILERIQDDIWKKIGLFNNKWKRKSQDEKASSIWNVLSKKRFMLLLDDVWERLDLKEIGVPLQNKKNKIAFTTRSEGVCGKMEADQTIRVDCLAESESWELFRMKVGEGTIKSHPEIDRLAQAVAKKCCGLPLVLTTIGCAMASKKTPEEWRDAIRVLRTSASKFPGMGDVVFPRLRCSHDSLPAGAVRSCFLYRSLFPEDYDISKFSLINHWICEGFLEEHNDMKEAKTKGYDIIATLTQACLFEKTSDAKVKLNGVIREMLLWIASEIGGVDDKFLVQTGCGLIEAPEAGRWLGKTRISLMNNKIEQLAESPDCPGLVTLFLENNRLKMITDSFFHLMPNLRVLRLKRNDITELPQSISDLVSLEYLDLSYTQIKELPIEMKKLGKLKCLLLLCMPEHFSIPKQLISSLSKLRVVDAYIRGVTHETPLKDNLLSDENNEALVEELESLQDLHDLGVPITTSSAFECLLRSDKLRSYISSLYILSLGTSSSLNITSFNNMKRLYELSISECGFLEDFEIDWARERKETIQSTDLNSKVSFQTLATIKIRKCGRLKVLTWLLLTPNLKKLTLESCDQMQEVVGSYKCGESAENGENLTPFAKLEELSLCDLPLLTSIFWKALPFIHLRKITVSKCPLLKKLPFDANITKLHGIVISGEMKRNEVEWVDEATRNAFLPCFRSS